MHRVSATASLAPWSSGDLPLLERLMGDPRMTEHLGGPESPAKLHARQGQYEGLEGGDRMFKIVDGVTGAGVGSVGFWTQEWRDEQVYEIGWMVVPEFQGRGIAVAATGQAIELARGDDKHRFNGPIVAQTPLGRSTQPCGTTRTAGGWISVPSRCASS